jgi:hypothetical protein
MAHSFRPADTSAEVFDRQIEIWRSMTIAERVALVDDLNHGVELLARSDILAKNPGLTELEIAFELARRRYGDELAVAAYAGRLP